MTTTGIKTAKKQDKDIGESMEFFPLLLLVAQMRAIFPGKSAPAENCLMMQSNPVTSRHEKQKAHINDMGFLFDFGGERGIRTLGGSFPPHSLSRRAPSASSAISPIF